VIGANAGRWDPARLRVKSVNVVSENTDPAVRLLILSAGDPESERAFSGSLRSLCRALERRGIVHHKANVNGYTDSFARAPLPIRVLQRVDKRNRIGHYRYSRLAFLRNSRRGRRAAAAHAGFNACLMYGTTFNPALEVPTYCYFDATAAQVCRAGQWTLGRLPKGKAQAVIDYQKRVFDSCTAIFPRSRWAAASVASDYGVPAGKVCVASAGPNHVVDPLPHKAYDAQTILFIGRDFERKGGPLIVEAFRRLREDLPDARLVIIGCTPPLEEPGIEIVGPVSKDSPGGLQRLLEYYSQASLFCVMSSFEPFGIVIVEAQDAHVPCVVPKRFAFTEMVVDAVTGRHVDKDDPALLARVFVELLPNPARLEAMGKAAHEHVRANYTWDVAAQRIHERIQQDLARLEFRGLEFRGQTTK